MLVVEKWRTDQHSQSHAAALGLKDSTFTGSIGTVYSTEIYGGLVVNMPTQDVAQPTYHRD